MNPEKKPKVLVYLFGSLGDTIVAIPALRAVRRHFRDAELVLLQNVQPGNIVSASQVIPENLIDGCISYDSHTGRFDKIVDSFFLWRDLRRHAFQTAVYLVISERPSRSVARDRLFFRACGIRRLIGFHPFSKEELYPFDERRQRPALTENEAARKLNRLEIDGIKSLPEDLQPPFLTFSSAEIERVKKWLAERGKKDDSRLIVVAPGCKTEANVWSTENFIEIGHRLLAENFQLLIVGGAAERDSAEKMISAWGAGINAAGEFSVRDSGAILSLCDFYIGLDTGTTHLAAAVGTPCFALYGERNNQGHWFPPGDGHTIVFHPVACAGCRAFTCPLPAHPCMRGITVESVWQNLREFTRSEAPETGAPSVKLIAV